MFFKKSFLARNIFLLLGIILAACSLPGQDPTPAPTDPAAGEDPGGGEIAYGEAMVSNVTVAILESFPVQVNAIVSGDLPDGCTTISEIGSSLEGNTFTIVLTTERDTSLACTEALVPYQEVVSLDVLGLSAGTYTVQAGGESAAFELAVDNVAQEEPTDEPVPTEAAAAISGVVWHDLCDGAGGEGCVEKDGGGYEANGTREGGEPGLEGVEVMLGEGACPSTGLASAFTNADGLYTFAALEAGTYCVTVNAQVNPNSGILIPGGWTTPEGEPAEITVELEPGETLLNTNFGWDFQFLPEPEDTGETPGSAEEKTCTDAAEFVSETVQDDTIIAAGQKFTKSWTLQNTGTCRWEKTYALVFVEGDQMDGADKVNLPIKVPPGEEVTVQVELTAPGQEGTYLGYWALEDQFGQQFGLGDGDEPFWVQIVVQGSIVDLGLGDPDWVDEFNNDDFWFLVDTADVEFSVDDGKMLLKAISTDTSDYWGLSLYDEIEDFYLQGTFSIETCSGLDRYGFIVRAEPNKGYVFNIACNGQFRVYLWDSQTYSAIQEWITSPSINAGSNQTNVVGIKAEGDKISLLINSVVVLEFEDDTFPSGQFGLLVASRNTRNMRVLVDKVELWELD